MRQNRQSDRKLLERLPKDKSWCFGLHSPLVVGSEHTGHSKRDDDQQFT